MYVITIKTLANYRMKYQEARRKYTENIVFFHCTDTFAFVIFLRLFFQAFNIIFCKEKFQMSYCPDAEKSGFFEYSLLFILIYNLIQ